MQHEVSEGVFLRSSHLEDLPAIRELIAPYVEQRILLPRTDEELARLVLNGFVAVAEGQIVGFSAIEVYSRKLAELQCLAVHPSQQGKGLGKILVRRCIQHARQLNVYELMAITASDALFQDCGFDYSLPDQKKALFVHPQEMDIEL